MIKKGDFVEIEFTGRLKENGKIFDLTDEELAKKEKIDNPYARYGSKVVCVGESNIVSGLDNALINKKVNEKFIVELKAEDAFGKKDGNLIRILALNIFTKQNIKPFPGLQVNLDGLFGVIKSVSGGRVVVDFNHPLAGRDVIYEVKINKIVDDDKEKIMGFLETIFNKDVKFNLNEGNLEITEEVNDAIKEALEKKLKELITSIKKVSFVK